MISSIFGSRVWCKHFRIMFTDHQRNVRFQQTIIIVSGCPGKNGSLVTNLLYQRKKFPCFAQWEFKTVGFVVKISKIWINLNTELLSEKIHDDEATIDCEVKVVISPQSGVFELFEIIILGMFFRFFDSFFYIRRNFMLFDFSRRNFMLFDFSRRNFKTENTTVFEVFSNRSNLIVQITNILLQSIEFSFEYDHNLILWNVWSRSASNTVRHDNKFLLLKFRNIISIIKNINNYLFIPMLLR